MSEERHHLIQLLNNNKANDWSTIRSQINILKNKISNRIKHLNNLHADQLAEQINSTDECRKMFEAVRTLANRKTNNGVYVKDENESGIPVSSVVETGPLGLLGDRPDH